MKLRRKYSGGVRDCLKSSLALIRGTEPRGDLHEFTRHRSHKAEDDLPYGCEVLELGYNSFIYIRYNKILVVEL